MRVRSRVQMLVVLAVLAVVASGCTLWGWGSNSSGQTGTGFTGTNYPVQESTASTWSTLEAGYRHSCGTKHSGELFCWGQNDDGQIGDGTTLDRFVPVKVGTNNDWKSVTGSADHTCGIRGTGTLWCWGRNHRGQLGDGTTTNTLTPVRVGTATDWTSVTAGQQHSCGIRAGGSLFCWGRNHRGQLGVGDTTDRLSPATVAGSWTKVDAGSFHTCGINSDQRLLCWGLNGSVQAGQVGNPLVEEVLLPAFVYNDLLGGTNPAWIDVAAGGQHTCGVLAEPQTVDDGRESNLACWGSARYGQAGNIAAPTISVPLPVGFGIYSADAYPDWREVTAGYNHTCGIRAGGTLWCFGRNTVGQLGTGSSAAEDAHPVQVGTLGGWQSVSGGYSHTIATRNYS